MEFESERRALRETPPAPANGAAQPAARERERGTTTGSPRIICTQCSSLIAFSSERISVSGSHEHDFVNPSGMEFRVACFASAPGTSGVGESSEVWTWFPGYAWQALVCRGCIGHVGWSFTKKDDSFVVLIVARVAELD